MVLEDLTIIDTLRGFALLFFIGGIIVLFTWYMTKKQGKIMFKPDGLLVLRKDSMIIDETGLSVTDKANPAYKKYLNFLLFFSLIILIVSFILFIISVMIL